MARDTTDERDLGETDGPAPLRDVAHLYEIADDLAARCQIGAAEVVNRLHYVVALGNLELGRLDDTVATCDRIIDELGERGDAAWMACAHALRGIARQVRGDHLAAVTDLVDAAVLLDDAYPTGQPYIYAVQQLAIGYKCLRLYELRSRSMPARRASWRGRASTCRASFTSSTACSLRSTGAWSSTGSGEQQTRTGTTKLRSGWRRVRLRCHAATTGRGRCAYRPESACAAR